MIKYIFILILIFSFLDASTKTIDKKIQSNQKILEKNESVQKKNRLTK